MVPCLDEQLTMTTHLVYSRYIIQNWENTISNLYNQT